MHSSERLVPEGAARHVTPQPPGRAGASLTPTGQEAIDAFAAAYPFPLDTFQIEAIQALESGRSVLVAAPTGTGKTVVADYGVDIARRAGMRAIYTAPIKALSNQKFHDWRAAYGDDVGLLTGDVSENPDGRILVMTTEVLRNMLLRGGDSLRDTAVVIFDEVHFLADPERGTTWEEAILSCPSHVRLVCLSATITNAAEVAQWIGRVHREVALIEHPTRAVPIDHLYYGDGELWPLVDADGVRHPPLRMGGESRFPRPDGVPRGARARDLPHPRDVLETLNTHGMLPVIWFQFGRRACEVAAAAACERLDLGGDREMRRRRDERVAATLAVLALEDRALQQVRDLTRLVARGVAFHHAGVLPVLKQLVEGMFADGLLAAVFATETLALGVNMPARSVVVHEHTKYDGTSRRALSPNEYAQLAGRAGRRGMDARGFSVNLYSPWTSCAEVQTLLTAELHPVRSTFTARYHTVASLWDGSSVGRDRLERLFASSLRQFQTDDALRGVLDEVESLRMAVAARHFACPIDGVDDDAVLIYGALRQDLADARRQVVRGTSAVDAAARDAGHLPWTPPAPSMVKRAMAAFLGGEVVHLSDWRAKGAADESGAGASAWAVFLRREGTGPGVFLVGEEVVSVAQWAMVTRLSPPRAAVTRLSVPSALRDAPIGGPADVYESSLRQGVVARVVALGLPDASRHEADREARQAALAARLVAPHVERVTSLTTLQSQHPCHTCTHRVAHERAWKLERDAQRSLEQAEGEASRVERLAATGATRTLSAIVGVLGEFGALTPVREGLASPTKLAAGLTEMYNPTGLILLNAARRGWFDRLNAADMMEVVSWFCFDRDAVRWNRFRLSLVAREVRDRLGELAESLAVAEARAALPITPGPSLVFEGAVTAWCRGAPFADLLEGIGVAEGDLLSVLNQTLDLASQLREGLRAMGMSDTGVAGGATPSLVATLAEGDRLVRRGLVAQSLRLIVAGAGPETTSTDAAGGAESPPAAPTTRRRRVGVRLRRRDPK